MRTPFSTTALVACLHDLHAEVCFDGSNATCEVVDLGGAADSTRLERLDASGTETQGACGVHADNGRIAGIVPVQLDLPGKLRALGATCKN